MAEHVRALGTVSLMRAALELLLGAYLIIVVNRWRYPEEIGSVLARKASAGATVQWVDRAEAWLEARFATLSRGSKPEPTDRLTFGLLGGLMVTFGVARLIQSTFSLLGREWSRSAGLFLALFDFLTPITLPLAFWSFVVYRHPETRDHFSRRRRGAEH
jgi:hypothetical protein